MGLFLSGQAARAAGIESEAGRYERAVQVLEEAKMKIMLDCAGEAVWGSQKV